MPGLLSLYLYLPVTQCAFVRCVLDTLMTPTMGAQGQPHEHLTYFDLAAVSVFTCLASSRYRSDSVVLDSAAGSSNFIVLNSTLNKDIFFLIQASL